MSLNIDGVKKILLKMAEVIEINKEELTQLDQVIGDGDHGHNLSRGFLKVKEELENNTYTDIASMLKKVAMVLISNVGGASGPLYGTAFLKASMSLANKTEMNVNDFSICLEEAINGIKLRGKANVGDKTMIDVLEPVSDLIKELISKNENVKDIFNKAVELANIKAEETKNIIAKKGRASYLGQRSIGHKDPGAQSSYLILKCISENI
ncbi:dihydroxyacetone kinase subunit DhaL [Mycoplasma feriruminatoris]|uniref:dihydroxyacetone kinase subunit DhaL n=1 Tax=Mycoplasma feriruminatoris TaxID=1179777 RepID=UPI0002A4E3EC|nr:dihydroxyacetone kinase subunit DhaL [Mycoplasma feriruminatoris]UKS54313.1 dihydroxyacetone kinase, L subunit [Mycoplasma feriruminatoris]WFQ96187.1 glycerone kinase [Mycoplasma feriruminatoris]VZK65491.1 PEP-dependent dihydroxyacetone kinase 2, ADP-binding subunit DhaL [Mycoplasma feriruminatoris]VZR75633.1 PEP-dependent dihydroxyacetone kinase 2, ADP-binding subunit DhaL [Mycoplasma feriruminatoris]VZR98155.1 PEP-dependent dihydroxyacetone kinase 2, ADP-binding subunit DhaL [Mycoplasma f